MRADSVVPPDALVRVIQRTPEGGVCVICAAPGSGAHTLARRALGAVPRWEPTCSAALHDTAAAVWANGGDWVHVDGVHRDHHPTAVAELQELLHDQRTCGRVLITTTSDLGRALAESRLAGRLVELDQGDLDLRDDQALTMLASTLDGCEPGVLIELVRLCRGWAAALELAAGRAADHPEEDTAAWLRTRGAELLMGPWLDDRDAATRSMLQGTAFLDVLHPALVEAVLPGQGAGITLLSLVRDPGPVRAVARPTRQGRVGYERHPLLTELLRHHALAQPPPRAAHERAAAWFREHGDLTSELENLFAAGRVDEAKRRLYANEDVLLASGHAQQALRWYESSPARETPTDLTHLLRVGWAAAFSGDSPTAREALGRLSSAVSRTRTDPPVPSPAYDSLEGEAEVLACWLAHQDGDLGHVIEASRRATALFGTDLSRNSHQIAPVFLARALTLVDRLDEAESLLEPLRSQTFPLGAISEDSRAEVEAELAWAQGRVHQSRAWSARRSRWSGEPPDRTTPGHRPPVAHWLAESEAGRTATAEDGLAALAADAEEGPLTIVTDKVVIHLALAHVRRRLGRHRDALASAAVARELVQSRSPQGGLLDTIARSEARTRLLTGDVIRAERLLRGVAGTPDAQLLRIRIGLTRGSPLARQMLREVDASTPRAAAEWAVLSAWAQRERSRVQAEHQLLRAAEVATANGLRTGLVGAPADLLEFAGRTARHYVDDGLQLLVDVAREAAPDTGTRTSGRNAAGPGPAAPAPPTALSRGELQLAALLPARLSNAELAQALGVSVNTVKTRLRRLFVKLGVHDRREAVHRVTALGLVEPRTPAQQ